MIGAILETDFIPADTSSLISQCDPAVARKGIVNGLRAACFLELHQQVSQRMLSLLANRDVSLSLLST